MKAIRIHEFGGQEVLKLEETECPVPAPDEILLKVYASGVNPVDLVVREGSSAAMRYNLILPLTLGWDAAGTVEAYGKEVTGFQKGDTVYGVPNFPGNGSYAEYCAAKASQFTHMPKNLNFSEAASVPLAALTAWTGMFEYGKLQAGHRFLIRGAAGNVGAFAVQFAKAKGAYVIGVASGSDEAYLKQLGADECIDYKTQKFEDMLHNIDLVLEASSVRDNRERLKSVKVLKTGGMMVSVNTDFPFDDKVVRALADKEAKGELAANQPRQEWLQEIAQLIEKGKVKPRVRKVYPLEQVAEAHQEISNSHGRGKIILEARKE